MAAAPSDDNFPSDDFKVESVGTLLRRQREERGEDLRYVAQILRIRYPYLKAIEDGHPDELPGPTYAVGFVRTYADHLGLDSEKLVQQFKEEAAGLQSRADLHFPAPLPEGKIPSGAVLVMAVMLAAAVYGGWIYFSSRDDQVAEMVPELPNRISEIIKGNPNAQGETPPSGTIASRNEPTADETPAQPEASPIGEADTETAMQTPAAEPAAEPAKAPEPLAAAEKTEEAPQQMAETTPPAAEPEPDATATPRSAEAIPQPPGSESGTPTPDASPSPALAEPTDNESTDTASAEGFNDAERAPPKVYGVENTGARIVIHAAADSWVEVRDSATDELLLTRVLFKGDKYQVPDRGGLTLLTGNAGGLRIVVDGSDAPAIGPLGAVRRNVALEPSALLAGNAARPSGGGLVPADSQTSDSGFQSQ